MFDFRSGEVKSWYPDNFVLRFLTPASTCRKLETFTVRLEQVTVCPPQMHCGLTVLRCRHGGKRARESRRFCISVGCRALDLANQPQAFDVCIFCNRIAIVQFLQKAMAIASSDP